MLLTLMIASGLSAAVSASEPITPPTVTIDAVAVTSAPGAPPPAMSSKTRYCVFDTLPASRIRMKICRTADEWIASEGQVPTGRIARR